MLQSVARHQVILRKAIFVGKTAYSCESWSGRAFYPGFETCSTHVRYWRILCLLRSYSLLVMTDQLIHFVNQCQQTCKPMEEQRFCLLKSLVKNVVSFQKTDQNRWGWETEQQILYYTPLNALQTNMLCVMICLANKRS